MFSRSVAVIGAGYVGLTTATCLASLGHRVTCADIDEAKIARLRDGDVATVEPGLAELVAEGLHAGRLSFVVDAQHAVAGNDVVLLCLPTPMGAGGAADLSAVELVLGRIRPVLESRAVVVLKSTVPVGTTARAARFLAGTGARVVSNPEFLREGSAVRDFLDPDRIVVGSDDPDAAQRVAALYARLRAPTVLTDAASAELTKYAANAFLATKLSFVNAVAELCERVGADIADVTAGMGHDRRIGPAFLAPGPGWGGSCLPKDTAALLQTARHNGHDFGLLRAAITTNADQHRRMVEKVRVAVTGDPAGALRGARLGLYGLAFKAHTDDLRDSPALAVAELLARAGAELTAYDPAVGPDRNDVTTIPATVVDDPYLAVKDADALVVLTDWPEFRGLDWVRIAALVRTPAVVDTRNLLDRDVLRRAGFQVIGVGRCGGSARA